MKYCRDTQKASYPQKISRFKSVALAVAIFLTALLLKDHLSWWKTQEILEQNSVLLEQIRTEKQETSLYLQELQRLLDQRKYRGKK